jgi:hypothetical protein
MPLIIDSPAAVGALLVEIGNLEFNRDRLWKVHTLDGWWDTVGTDAQMVPSGGVGAVAVGPWLPKERYLTVAGHVLGMDPFEVRRLLLAEFGTDASVTVTYPDGSTERIFVRPFDSFSLVPKGQQLRFALPLVALDPWKYAADPLSGDVGVFTGQRWHRELTEGTEWYWPLTSGTEWHATFEQDVPDGPYPPSVTLTSGGDATSQRLVATVTGPLTAGDWWLMNETTGERLWVEVSIVADQELVLDMRARTARLNGATVDHLVYGDWLSLVPGANTYRLVSGTASDAHASFSALPAYQ